MKFMQHVGVASWFSRLCNAQSDFVSRERIVWVDIEGVPLHAWSRSTFNKIGSRWGEVMELEECNDDFFACKRICIKTKQEDNILEKFKDIIHGKIFVLRAKELFVWSSVLKDVAEVVYCSDDESVKDADEPPLNEKETSNDPFNIYDLLKKHDKGEVNSRLDMSFPYPPGFTPEKDNLNIDVQEVKGMDQAKSQSRSEGLCSRILEETQSLDEHLSSEIRVNGHEQKRRFYLGGLGSKAKKEWIRELNIKHKVNFLTLQETKMDSISAMDVKLLWGNYNFDHVFSEAVGNSGGILCT
nr:RNA-directed DNA polymerase, eukaryota [Tanacetum cinerariifolium]